MLKKSIVGILILLVSVSIYAGNSQKTYIMSDDVWRMADIACRLNGVLGPLPVSPSVQAEIEVALDRIDEESASGISLKILDKINAAFSESKGWSYKDKSLVFDPFLSVNPQFYFFNNGKSTMETEYILKYRDRDPFFVLGFDASVFDNAYLYFEYEYMDNPATFSLSEEGKQIIGPYFHNLSNFAFFINPAMNGEWTGLAVDNNGNEGTSLFSHQPLKVGGSFGNSFLNFFIGRSRQAFGNGKTGNMIIGDNFSYQEMAELSLFTNVFSYHLSLTHFDNAENNQSFTFDGYHQNRSIQRLDFNIGNKFRFAVNIGALIYSRSVFDWRMVMPMMLVHGWNNNSEDIVRKDGDEINNILGFELEWVLTDRIMLTAQIAIDQFRLPVETTSEVPSAYGFMMNAKVLTPIEYGVFDSWVEFVYTNPYLYLNYKKDSESGPDNYCMDHISGYYWKQSGKGELDYLGHSFGPDAIGVSIGTDFISFHDLDASIELLYRIHGQMGIGPNQNMSNRDVDDNTKKTTPTGIPEHTLQVRVSGNYFILPSLSVNCTIADRLQWNYHNERDVFRHSIQGAVGIRWIIV